MHFNLSGFFLRLKHRTRLLPSDWVHFYDSHKGLNRIYKVEHQVMRDFIPTWNLHRFETDATFTVIAFGSIEGRDQRNISFVLHDFYPFPLIWWHHLHRVYIMGNIPDNLAEKNYVWITFIFFFARQMSVPLPTMQDNTRKYGGYVLGSCVIFFFKIYIVNSIKCIEW